MTNSNILLFISIVGTILWERATPRDEKNACYSPGCFEGLRWGIFIIVYKMILIGTASRGESGKCLINSFRVFIGEFDSNNKIIILGYSSKSYDRAEKNVVKLSMYSPPPNV